jgi:parallel beta-helix repeat protein
VTVQPGESIQAAIDQATKGDVLCLAEGTWEENLVIEKSLTLRGMSAERTVIDGVQEGYPVVWIMGPEGEAQTVSVKVEGLTITGAEGGCADPDKEICAHGVLIQGAAQVAITDSTISGNGDSILLWGSAQATIEGNEIINNQGYGVALYLKICGFAFGAETFQGHVAGRKNTIPGPDEPDGNKKGAVCPEELGFLMTEEGGEYPLRSPMKGSPDAPVTIVEFADFMCRYCARFATETLPKIEEEYIKTGKVRFVFRNFPFLGKGSTRAAEAALCAHEQRRFWDYHDRLFADSLERGREVFSPENLKALAAELGLDTERFNKCVDTRKYADMVQEDLEEGRRLEVTGVPTFFINDRKVVGAQPYEVFQRIIEEELAEGR